MSDRTYLITGSASGIGLALRSLLEQQGSRVIGVDLHDAEIVLDLSDPRERNELAHRVRSLGITQLNAIVPSAGVGGSSSSTRQVVSLNYFGALSTVLQLRPLLLASDAPRVCMLSSIALLLVAAEHAELEEALAKDEEMAHSAFTNADASLAYAVTKRALARWVREVAVSESWTDKRVLINCVAPGTIATNMTARLLADPARLAGALKRIPHPLGIGQPEDIAPLIAFLVSRENRFVTGQVIFADGGHEALTCGPSLPRRPPQ